MYTSLASLYFDFWMKTMRFHQPTASEEDLLESFKEAFKQCIERREHQMRLKRGRSNETPDGSDDTVADTPPLAKRRLESVTPATIPRSSPLVTTMEDIMSENDTTGDGAHTEGSITEAGDREGNFGFENDFMADNSEDGEEIYDYFMGLSGLEMEWVH